MSVSRKVQMGAGGSGGDPWTFDQAEFVGGTGNNNVYKYEANNSEFPVGVAFKSDGTKMVVNSNDSSSGALFETYTLANPWDLDSATRDSSDRISTGYTSAPDGLKVNDDGTKFYFVDTSWLRLYQCEFATAWDTSSALTLTTITSVVDPTSTGSESIGMFNGDGTVYYVINNFGTIIKVFNLTTAYDLSTGVTAGTDITTISGQGFADVTDQGMSSDGTVLYVRDTNLRFTAVEMTTPFDLSTLDWGTKTSNAKYGAVLAGNVAAQLAGGFHVATDSSTFTRIFTANIGISSAIYNGAASASALSSVKLEMPSRVYTPPPSLSSSSTPPWGTGWYINGINFNADGSKLLIGRHYNDSTDPYYLFEETLSTAYNVGTTSYVTSGTNFYNSSGLASYSQNWSEDGQNLLAIFSGANFRCFNYSSAFDPSSYVNFDAQNKYYRASAFNEASSMMFNDAKDELTFAVYGYANTSGRPTLPAPMPPGLYTVPLGTTGDITTMDTSGFGRAIVTETGDTNNYNNTGLEFDSSGSTYTCLNLDGDYAKTVTPPTSYGVTTYDGGTKTNDLLGPYNDNLAYRTVIDSFSFNNDGTKAYLLDATFNCIRIYSLSTAYDVSDIRLNDPGKPDNTWRQTDVNTNTSCLTMNPTGTKLYQADNNTVAEYSLSTAWDLSTTSATANASLTVSNSSFGGDIAWGNNGNYLFRLTRSSTAGILERYAASTAYDLGSCGTTPDKTFTFGTVPYGTFTQQDKMFFKPDGSAVYMYAMSLNSNTEYIFQWNMSTAWDPTSIASTTTPDNYKTMPLINDDWAAGIWIKSDGSTLCIAQQTQLYKFDFGTNWDASTLPSSSASNDDRYYTYYMVGSSTGTQGLYIDSTGTKMFRGMDGTGGDYILKTEFGSELSFKTMTHDGGSHIWYWSDPVLDGVVPRTIAFGNTEFRWKPDGTSIYIIGRANSTLAYPQAYYQGSNLLVHQFNLTTAWDLSTASHYGYNVVISSVSASSIYSFDISSNGEHLITAYYGQLWMSTLTTPWDVTSAGVWDNIEINTNETWGNFGYIGADVNAIRWHPSNGNSIYIRGEYGNAQTYTHKVNLSTEYDPTTASIAIEGTAVYNEVLPTGGFSWPFTSGSQPYFVNLMFKDSGNYLYMLQKDTNDQSISSSDKYILAFELSTPYDISTATPLTSFKFQYDSPPNGNDFTNNTYWGGSAGYFDWNSDGTRFFVVSSQLIGEYKV